MTTTDSILAAAEHLLRRDAEELRESSTSSQDRDDWTGEEEAKEDYDKHIAAADALASLSTAEPVRPLYGWVLVPAKPTREWIGAVADDGYADCDVAQLIASILSHAPAAPAAVTRPSVWGFRFPTGGKWHYTEHGPNDRSRKELIWRPFYEAPQPAVQQGPSAMQALTDAIHADQEYAWSWHCNLAMPIMDHTKVSHRVANLAAARLMQHLFDIDTEQHPCFQVDDGPAAPAAQGDAEDAARYRWLRELRAHANPPIHGSVWVVKYHQQPGTIPELRSAGFGEVLDATIDADRAVRAAKEGDKP